MNTYHPIYRLPFIVDTVNHRVGTYVVPSSEVGKRFQFRSRVRDISGADTTYTSRLINVDRVTSVEGEPPLQFKLEQNYPNSFNPSTMIEFCLPECSFVKVTLA